MIKKALSPVAQAYERGDSARKTLSALDARCMEVTEDKAGILWERWIVGRSNVILFATPHGWDLFASIAPTTETTATLDALRALAAK
jgi:hypothetical protein